MKANLNKKVSCDTLRHSFAAHLIETGVDIYTLHKLMGHKSIQTTKVYVRKLPIESHQVVSPLDR